MESTSRWPLDEGFSFGGDRAKEIHLEPRVGGRLYEKWADGDEFQTGRVIECDPPRRIVFTWRDEEGRGEMEVDVLFTPEGDGTLVTVEHRVFERLGPGGEEDLAARYAGGWPRVLQAYASKTLSRLMTGGGHGGSMSPSSAEDDGPQAVAGYAGHQDP